MAGGFDVKQVMPDTSMTVSPREVAAAVDALLREHDRFDFVRLLDSFELLDDLPDTRVADTPAVTRLRCPRPEA